MSVPPATYFQPMVTAIGNLTPATWPNINNEPDFLVVLFKDLNSDYNYAYISDPQRPNIAYYADYINFLGFNTFPTNQIFPNPWTDTFYQQYWSVVPAANWQYTETTADHFLAIYKLTPDQIKAQDWGGMATYLQTYNPKELNMNQDFLSLYPSV